jgi:hypothetical protein
VKRESPTPDETAEATKKYCEELDEPVDEFVTEAARGLLEQTEW